jgi:hypothetical protein
MTPNETSERALREKAFQEAIASLWPSRMMPTGSTYEAVKERVLAGEIDLDQAVNKLMKVSSRPMDHAEFGAWADQGEDGLAYQERLREEW